MEEWAKMWTEIKREAEQQEELEIVSEGAEALLAREGPPEIETKEETENCKIVVSSLLDTVADEMDRIKVFLKDLADKIRSSEDSKELSLYIAKEFLKESAKHAGGGDEKPMAGEWINMAITKIDAECDKTQLRMMNSLLKAVLFKIVPYDISYPMPTRMRGEVFQGISKDVPPQQEEVEEEEEMTQPEEIGERRGKRSKLSVGQYVVKSVTNEKGERWWPCPMKEELDCGQTFRSSRKCGAHLNEHLNRVYECPACKYVTYSLDSYEKHKCFSGIKTHGGSRRDVPQYKKKKPEATVSVGPVEEVKEIESTEVAKEGKKRERADKKAMKKPAEEEEGEASKKKIRKVEEKQETSPKKESKKREKRVTKPVKPVKEEDIIVIDSD